MRNFLFTLVAMKTSNGIFLYYTYINSVYIYNKLYMYMWGSNSMSIYTETFILNTLRVYLIFEVFY